MAQILQVAAISLATLGTGAATVSIMNEDVPDLAVPEEGWRPGHELDGRTFEILGTDFASGAVLDNKISFRDGTFQSADCQNYCDFGWSSYQTRDVDGLIQFTARTICPDAPHTVVWHGTVYGEEIALEGTWTTRRWYWTNQIVFTATGIATIQTSES